MVIDGETYPTVSIFSRSIDRNKSDYFIGAINLN